MEIAANVVVDRGYEGLRYADVSEASGVAVASLRHYFPTIDGLRREALRHQVRAELRHLEVQVGRLEGPWEQLSGFIRHAMGIDEHARRSSWLVWLEYWRIAARDAGMAEDWDSLDAEWTTMIQQVIEAGVSEGRFVLDQSSYDAALEVTALVDGFGPAVAIAAADNAVTERLVAIIERAARRMVGMPPVG